MSQRAEWHLQLCRHRRSRQAITPVHCSVASHDLLIAQQICALWNLRSRENQPWAANLGQSQKAEVLTSSVAGAAEGSPCTSALVR